MNLAVLVRGIATAIFSLFRKHSEYMISIFFGAFIGLMIWISNYKPRV